MKKLLFFCFLIFSPVFIFAQEAETIARDKLVLRPNSRDYNIIKKGNNHQKVIQIRKQAMLRHKQAVLNRKMAMERRRIVIQQQMLRQQNVHRRMIHQRMKNR